MNSKKHPAGTPRQALLREEMLRKATVRYSGQAANTYTVITPGQPLGVAGTSASNENSRDLKNKTRFAAGIFQQLATLYAKMQEAYTATAESAGLSCGECPQNCCHSYFRHHSFVEWAYLWRGVQKLPDARRKTLLERAKIYAAETELAQSSNAVPSVPCPLLEDGRCSLYSHRLMICRMHGTRNFLTMPDGRVKEFSGCFRYVEQTAGNPTPPTLDRTPFYSRLAALEVELRRRKNLPGRVNLTIAEMLLTGPPR